MVAETARDSLCTLPAAVTYVLRCTFLYSCTHVWPSYSYELYSVNRMMAF